MITVKFLIDRGHDGPARMGRIEIGSAQLKSPLLMGPSSIKPDIVSEIIGASENEFPSIISLGSVFSKINSDIEKRRMTSLFLLPSLPSASFLEGSDIAAVLDAQLTALSELNPSDAVVRIPSSISETLLEEYVKRFHEQGVQSAVFTFNGDYGRNDLNNILLKTKLPRNWLILSTGRILPAMIPLLFYLGFDIIDAGLADAGAADAIRFWPMSFERITSKETPRFCSCSACHSHDDLSLLSEHQREEVLREHNSNIYRSVLSESLSSMKQGKLRWLVESFTHSSPSLASLLRHVDKQNYEFLEEFTPTTGSGMMPLIGPESYNSPAVRRYREFLADRYKPPLSKKIVLLLPCSARKPYSDSKSHKRFSFNIESAIGSKNRAIAETVLTSPLGVVPRELERGFPLANYDIPVTGFWDTEETEIASDLLSDHMKKFDESTVIVAHVSGGYLDIVKNAEPDISQTIIYTTGDESASSRNSLDNLRETLIDVCELLDVKGGRPTTLEDTLRATADFQFGLGAGALLIPPEARVGGKVYGTIICRLDKEQLCAFIGATGKISLTLPGAHRIAELKRYWVRFEGDTVKGSTLFAIGINEADYAIRPGDEVIVIDPNDNVIAVGRSEMSGREMCDFDNGRAVSIRHKVG
ncbi:MAG: DUF5591 domain-containing protein [Candidatus Thorarchaeota archaeon]